MLAPSIWAVLDICVCFYSTSGNKVLNNECSSDGVRGGLCILSAYPVLRYVSFFFL